MAFDFAGSHVVITGASSGIGESFARLLAAKAAGRRPRRLTLVARSRERLDQLAEELDVDCEVLPCDLANRAARDSMLDALVGEGVDALINNAGLGLYGRFEDQDEARLAAVVELNVMAVLSVTRRLLPPMVASGRGLVYTVGSIAGIQGCPYMACYGGTKSFVNDFSEALSEELRGTGVQVGVLCPGSTRTGFFSAAGLPPEGIGKFFESADSVAKRGIRAIERGQVFKVSGWLNAGMVQAQRISPRAMVRRLAEITLREGIPANERRRTGGPDAAS